MRPRTREEEMVAFDRKSESQLRAEAYADLMMARFSHVESHCETHGLIDEPDEGRYCTFCGEPCDMRPVCR